MQLVEITRTKLLVVEGADDVGFFDAFLAHLGITDVQIVDLGGVPNLRDGLKALSIAPNRESVVTVGVIRDCDGDPSAAFDSIRFGLRATGWGEPTVQGEFVGAEPRVGGLVLPDAATDGMLETLCLRAVQADPSMACVDGFLDCLPIVPENVAKTTMHVFLATKPRLKSFRYAAPAGYWDWAHVAFEEVRQFLLGLDG